MVQLWASPLEQMRPAAVNVLEQTVQERTVQERTVQGQERADVQESAPVLPRLRQQTLE